jgi:hypothetical protein
MDSNVSAVIAKLFLHFGRWFWTRLDLQKTPLFENLQNCTILYRSLFLMKLTTGADVSELLEKPKNDRLIKRRDEDKLMTQFVRQGHLGNLNVVYFYRDIYNSQLIAQS